ncbi:esterase [Candida orthopsilosis Co 90-125]|uniref:Esterase n=1 Tax=Candida orthopsilosis (strain 90-125) TaxID=1136231 RepID=H8XAG7_CANO9|nr:esterase [Candida orthopsilosis Co 90-125]CCG24816.1 esterase [Candida orthopsilosis Co 90-125]
MDNKSFCVLDNVKKLILHYFTPSASINDTGKLLRESKKVSVLDSRIGQLRFPLTPQQSALKKWNDMHVQARLEKYFYDTKKFPLLNKWSAEAFKYCVLLTYVERNNVIERKKNWWRDFKRL